MSLDVVTGAFSYTGRAIAAELLRRGRRVRTLSRDLVPGQVEIEQAPLQFADRRLLAESLRGAETLYNTYWIRFPRGGSTYERAIANTRTLLGSAQEAGVRRLVHVSVSRPDEGSTLPYFRGKAEVERAVRESGLLFGIVRPTLVFGADDILVNNIAWVLRRFPFFVLAGRGDYRVQPVSVADVARLCVDVRDNSTIDAAGPETFTFEELVRLVAAAVGSGARILHTSPRVMLGFGLVVGRVLGDVVLTPEELRGLMLSLLTSDAPPTGRDGFREWVAANADRLGRAYASELRRNYRHAPL